MYLKFSFSDIGYALVAGLAKKNESQITEVLYVNGTTKICHSTANYPENVNSLTGGSFLKNNLIVACGGKLPDITETSACYSMSDDLKWTNFANLTNATVDAASVIVKNGLWVTGTGKN